MLNRQISTALGNPLSEEDIARGKVLSVLYRPKARYSWATGIAVARFLKGLREGRIIGTRCNNCERVVVPPRIFCEWCFRRTDSWIDLPDSGSVNTYSVSYIATDTTRLKDPLIPAVIQIDGTSNAGLLHLIGGVDADKVKIGMRVRARWLEAPQRKGSITDIKHFFPQEK